MGRKGGEEREEKGSRGIREGDKRGQEGKSEEKVRRKTVERVWKIVLKNP